MTRSNDIWYTDSNEFIKRICFSFTYRTHAYENNIVNNEQLIYSWRNFGWKKMHQSKMLKLQNEISKKTHSMFEQICLFKTAK